MYPFKEIKLSYFISSNPNEFAVKSLRKEKLFNFKFFPRLSPSSYPHFGTLTSDTLLFLFTPAIPTEAISGYFSFGISVKKLLMAYYKLLCSMTFSLSLLTIYKG